MHLLMLASACATLGHFYASIVCISLFFEPLRANWIITFYATCKKTVDFSGTNNAPRVAKMIVVSHKIIYR